MKKEDAVTFNKERVEIGVSSHGYGYTYFAKEEIKRDEEIMRGYGRILDHQTAHSSVQIGLKKHYLPTRWTGAYWDHSCDPNSYIKTRSDGFPSLYAARRIQKGEEITYPYWATELTWTKGTDELRVACKCGGAHCKGKIFSFSQLSPKEQSAFKKKGGISRYLLTLP